MCDSPECCLALAPLVPGSPLTTIVVLQRKMASQPPLAPSEFRFVFSGEEERRTVNKHESLAVMLVRGNLLLLALW